MNTWSYTCLGIQTGVGGNTGSLSNTLSNHCCIKVETEWRQLFQTGNPRNWSIYPTCRPGPLTGRCSYQYVRTKSPPPSPSPVGNLQAEAASKTKRKVSCQVPLRLPSICCKRGYRWFRDTQQPCLQSSGCPRPPEEHVPGGRSIRLMSGWCS